MEELVQLQQIDSQVDFIKQKEITVKKNNGALKCKVCDAVIDGVYYECVVHDKIYCEKCKVHECTTEKPSYFSVGHGKPNVAYSDCIKERKMK